MPGYTFNAIGQFEVELEANNGSPLCADRKKVLINVTCPVEADFVVNTQQLKVGEPFAATNQSENANSYSWQINGVDIASSNDLTYTFSSAGFYYVRLNAFGTGCSDSHALLVEVLDPNPCNTSTGLYWQLNNGDSTTKLIYEAFTPDGYQYLNVYHPSNSGTILKNPPQWGNTLEQNHRGGQRRAWGNLPTEHHAHLGRRLHWEVHSWQF